MTAYAGNVGDMYLNFVATYDGDVPVIKRNFVKLMTEFCKAASNEEVYMLKKMMETTFSIDVGCKHFYISPPNSYGCDLREIIFNRDGSLTDGGDALLREFKHKALKTQRWHILTDIDDTLYAHNEHGTYTAGSDTSWKQKEAYPGIIEFYRLFYAGLPIESQYSTILSATPGFLKSGKLTNALLQSIVGENFGFIQGVEGIGELTPHLGEFVEHARQPGVATASNSQLYSLFGNTKYQRFLQYSKLFPEYKFLFIGDNGQGDVLAGKHMLQSMPRDSCKVFIHRVANGTGQLKITPDEIEMIENLYFFNNYSELAEMLNVQGIIFTPDDVLRVKTAAKNAITGMDLLNPLYQVHIPKFQSISYSNTPIINKMGGRRRRSKTMRDRFKSKPKYRSISKKSKFLF